MRRTIAALSFCLVFSVLAYGAKKFQLTGTTVTPAARGEVAVSTDKKNGNTKVKIKVEHLAPPANLTPPMSGYVVWFKDRTGALEAQGRLRIDKNLKASFETTTPWKAFDVSITAENDPSVKAPTGSEVLNATVQQ
jgi:hypothetical protein